MGQLKPFLSEDEEKRRRALYHNFILTHKDTLTEYSRQLLDYQIHFDERCDGYEIVLKEGPSYMG